MLLQALRSHELESFEIKEKAYAVASGAVSILSVVLGIAVKSSLPRLLETTTLQIFSRWLFSRWTWGAGISVVTSLFGLSFASADVSRSCRAVSQASLDGWTPTPTHSESASQFHNITKVVHS
jgi:hypothetical protein